MAQVASAADSRFDYLTQAGDSERKKVMDEYQRWSLTSIQRIELHQIANLTCQRCEADPVRLFKAHILY